MYESRKKGEGFAVFAKGSKKVIGSHPNKEAAQAQVDSLTSGYNSPDALKKRNVTPNYAAAAKRRRTTQK